MAPRSSDASVRRRICGALLVISMIASLAFNTVGALALQSDSMTACVDVGVQLHIRRRAAMPLEELSELQTGKSCAKTTIMATIAKQAQFDLKNTELRVLDCVTTRIDEELLGLYAITRVCLQQQGETGATTMDASALDAHVRPQIQRVFGPLSDAPSRGLALQYHQSKVECEKLVISTSYTRKGASEDEDPIDDKTSAPRFKYKSAELWTVPAESNPLNTLVVLKLKVKNDGAAPLHVFAATIKSTDDTAANLDGLLVLVPDAVQAIAPKTDTFVLFKFEVLHELALQDQANFAVYFAHTASRAHTLDAKLDGKKLKISDTKKKFASKNKKAGAGLGTARLDETETLETVYAAFPYGAWQLMSVGIVMTVGIVTTVYMRRKWTRVHWSRSLDCFKAKPLKHKSSSLEMATKRPAYDPEDPSDAAVDTLESDGLLDPSSDQIDASTPPPPQIKRPMTSKLREKMPAITMQWKKPAVLREKLSIRRVLKLDAAARLDPKRFESLWEEFIQRHNVSFQATKRPSTETFVAVMARAGISCMASGTVNGVEKYVLYAKQRDANDLFFVSVDILATSNETNVSIRASKDTHESLVAQFITLVDQQLEILIK